MLRVTDDDACQELYVISNRDVRALRALDLWLESVDTLQIIPNFPDDQPSYSLPSLDGIDWKPYSDVICQVARHKDYNMVLEATQPQLLELLQFCWKYDPMDVVAEVYGHLVGAKPTGSGSVLPCPPERVQTLVEYLHFKPSMAIHFSRLCPWSSHSRFHTREHSRNTH